MVQVFADLCMPRIMTVCATIALHCWIMSAKHVAGPLTVEVVSCTDISRSTSSIDSTSSKRLLKLQLSDGRTALERSPLAFEPRPGDQLQLRGVEEMASVYLIDASSCHLLRRAASDQTSQERRPTLEELWKKGDPDETHPPPRFSELPADGVPTPAPVPPAVSVCTCNNNGNNGCSGSGSGSGNSSGSMSAATPAAQRAPAAPPQAAATPRSARPERRGGGGGGVTRQGGSAGNSTATAARPPATTAAQAEPSVPGLDPALVAQLLGTGLSFEEIAKHA